jgi:hypothetical protein
VRVFLYLMGLYCRSIASRSRALIPLRALKRSGFGIVQLCRAPLYDRVLDGKALKAMQPPQYYYEVASVFWFNHVFILE